MSQRVVTDCWEWTWRCRWERRACHCIWWESSHEDPKTAGTGVPTPSGYSNANLGAAVKGFDRCHYGPKSVNLRKGDYPGWTIKRDRGLPSGRDLKHEGALPFQFSLLYGSQGPKNDLQKLAATGQQRMELCWQPGRVGSGVGCGPSWEPAADLLHVRPGWRSQGSQPGAPDPQAGR